MRRAWKPGLWGLLGLLVLAGCSGSTMPSGDARGMGAPAANPPAIVQAVPSVEAGVPPAEVALPADTAAWTRQERTAGDMVYSYSYPPGWTADLAYCAPGAARSTSGSELPSKCVSSDILVGQKAKDVGNLTGGQLTNITIDGKQALQQIIDNPRNTMASRIFTVILYDGTGVPLVGFSTLIGQGTDEATTNSITATLGKIASTLRVGR